MCVTQQAYMTLHCSSSSAPWPLSRACPAQLTRCMLTSHVFNLPVSAGNLMHSSRL